MSKKCIWAIVLLFGLCWSRFCIVGGDKFDSDLLILQSLVHKLSLYKSFLFPSCFLLFDTEDKHYNITSTNMDITETLYCNQTCRKQPYTNSTALFLWDSTLGSVCSCACACGTISHTRFCSVIANSVGQYCCIQRLVDCLQTKAMEHIDQEVHCKFDVVYVLALQRICFELCNCRLHCSWARNSFRCVVL